MESTIDFFRFREREAFIALSQGAASDAIAARRECQLASLGKWHGRSARCYTRKMRAPQTPYSWQTHFDPCRLQLMKNYG